MKKIIASVGLFALGASSLNAVYGQEMVATTTKPWSISASLRGFYDDNINTAPKNSGFSQESFGYQINPGAALNWQDDQTVLQAGYVYTLRWYDKKPFGNTSHYDQDHAFNGSLDHTFTERYRIGVTDSFVVGQEPDLLRSSQFLSDPQRVPGDNIRNNGTINFDAQLTPIFALELGYANSYYNYHDTTPFDQTGIPSLGAELNRIENVVHLDGRFQLLPETIGIIGYQYSQADYTGDDKISVDQNTGFTLFSDSRNYRANYGYVGVDQNFLPDLSGSLRVGLRDTDYYNSPSGGSHISPYVNASLKYNYTTESSAQVGFSYDRTATDIVAPFGTSVTLDQEAAVIFANVNHRIFPKVYGTLTAQVQDATFNGGQFNNKSEQYYLIGLNFQYRINPYLSTDIGYNYDKVQSEIGRTYDRNRVYIGLTASY
ncbi:MAG TPA: outer membrane beta-barrel protein [Verrucomicrobiae bacterium]|nr:outer membrane beta-barrel protein [Verrucomicrobiae bacterium]